MNNIILELVKSLDKIEFEMTPEQTEQLRLRIADSRLQNVRSYFGRSWAVQMRIAGAAWTLGVTKKLHVAARFSDMCHLYFTQIGARNFRSEEFNFDKVTAEADLKHPTAGPLLGELTGVIFPNGVTAKPVKAKRRTLRGELEALRNSVHILLSWASPELRQSKLGRQLNVELLGPDATPEDITAEVELTILSGEYEEPEPTDVDTLRERVRELEYRFLEIHHFMITGEIINYDTWIAENETQEKKS